MTLVEMQVKWSVTLTHRLGPEILAVLERKGQVLHRVRFHVKVPGWLFSSLRFEHMALIVLLIMSYDVFWVR